MGKRDRFTLITCKEGELVSVRDHGKSLEVSMPNSFGSLLKVVEDDKMGFNCHGWITITLTGR